MHIDWRVFASGNTRPSNAYVVALLVTSIAVYVSAKAAPQNVKKEFTEGPKDEAKQHRSCRVPYCIQTERNGGGGVDHPFVHTHREKLCLALPANMDRLLASEALLTVLASYGPGVAPVTLITS